MFLHLDLKFFILYLVHYSLLRKILLRYSKRKLSGTKFVYGHTHTPYIASANFFHFDAFQDLWRHILRSSCESDAFINIDDLRGQSEISNFNLLIFDQDICWFYIAMHEILWREIVARRYDLSRKIINLFLISLKEMLLDVLLEIAFAILKEKIKIIGGFFNI